MEVTTVVGIVIAVIIMLFGLKMLFKKPADAAPSLDSELHVDSDSQQPVIPRHVRDQLQNATETSSAEPAQDVTTTEAKTENAESAVDSLEPELAKTVDVAIAQSLSVEKTEAKEPAEFSLNANIAKAEISEFE
ncbi:MAG: cell division protein ZipA, partial [Acinetobacter sp.]